MAENDDKELPEQPEEEYEGPPSGFDALRSKADELSKEALA